MKYNQLTQQDRIIIQTLLKQIFSYSAIGKVIGKHKSTISREIERICGQRGYRSKHAHHFAISRKINSNKHLRLTHSIIIHIENKLKISWSAEQISNWMKKNQDQ